MRCEAFNIIKIFGFCEKICYFFIVNLLFLIFTTPVLLFFLFLGISKVSTYLPLFMVCMLSVPPALAAVLYAMNRISKGEESGACRDFLKGYKTDFWQKCKLGAFQLILLFGLWTDIRFFSEQVIIVPLVIIFTMVFIFFILITPNLYLLSSRYVMTNRNIIKSACILTITRPICTLGCTASLGIVLMFFELIAGTTILFMVSIYGFLVVYISKGMFQSLEDKKT